MAAHAAAHGRIGPLRSKLPSQTARHTYTGLAMVQSSSTSPPPTGEVSQASDSRYVSRTHRTRLTRARSQLLVVQGVVVAAG